MPPEKKHRRRPRKSKVTKIPERVTRRAAAPMAKFGPMLSSFERALAMTVTDEPIQRERVAMVLRALAQAVASASTGDDTTLEEFAAVARRQTTGAKSHNAFIVFELLRLAGAWSRGELVAAATVEDEMGNVVDVATDDRPEETFIDLALAHVSTKAPTMLMSDALSARLEFLDDRGAPWERDDEDDEAVVTRALTSMGWTRAAARNCIKNAASWVEKEQETLRGVRARPNRSIRTRIN